DPATGRQTREPLTGHTGGVWAVCTLPGTDPTRTLLATTGIDGTIRIWDPTTGQQTREPLTRHTSTVCAACTLPRTHLPAHPPPPPLLATPRPYGPLPLWAPTPGHQPRDPLTGHTSLVRAVCTLPGTDPTGHPDGRTLLATTSLDGTVRVWDPITGRQT